MILLLFIISRSAIFINIFSWMQDVNKIHCDIRYVCMRILFLVFYASWYDEWWNIGWKVILEVNPRVINVIKGLFLYALVYVFEFVENLWLCTCCVKLIWLLRLWNKWKWLKVLEKRYYHMKYMDVFSKVAKLCDHEVIMYGHFHLKIINFILLWLLTDVVQL